MPACPSCGYDSEKAFRFCPECGAEQGAAAASREQRRTVTVVFCDLAGSTALGESLDPERLRALLARYFERMKGIVESHGGTVEKFIGDAVMAVFGVPTVHEDDALRAVRSAIEMRDALPELGLQGRIGVMTGEVVAGTTERLVTGDAVNVAARLEQAAAPGEVLIGQPTLVLVRDAAEVEPVEPLALKGKGEPVAAHRLLRVREMPERWHGALFVGREGELALIREAWKRVRAERRCELVTITGDAGVGKSRLVAEALASIEATVVRGRCLPYGEGITYWPVIEVLKQLDTLPDDETASEAIRSLLGESDAPTSAEEIAWAFRKTLEHAAAERPLAVLFDDIHWGEQTFHDLIEHVALLSTGAPILLLCMARPELVEHRPTWPVTLRLEPLDARDVDELIGPDIPGELHERVARAAGGNPLFIGEMLAMAADSAGEVSVPPTLQALLAARLDQLEPLERGVLERGSIEGENFHRGAVQALAPEDAQVTPQLASLVRKQLIRPDRPQLLGEDGFRFRHLLLRDAAYDALPKSIRADLHQRFAQWLELHGANLVELDELLGYHLEQACHYHAELEMPVEADLAAAARARLAAGGRRALLRSDYRAAATLLERAAALVPAIEIDLALEAELGDAMWWAGRGADGLRRAAALVERGSAADDLVAELCGRIQQSILRGYLEPEGATEELATLLEKALPVFRAAGDDVALYVGYTALGQVANMQLQMDAGREACDRAAAHGERAGLATELLGWRAAFRHRGTLPVPALLEWLDENEPRERRNPWQRAYRAAALARLGRFEEARAILATSRAELADRGGWIALADSLGFASEVELWAGDPAAAVELVTESCSLLEQLGERSQLSTQEGMLGQALYALDRFDEADARAGRARDLGASDDAITQMLWRQVRAKVFARCGDQAEAERLAQEAVAIGETSDYLDAQGDAHGDLAEVLLLGGKPAEAAAALAQALARYERKGNVVAAARLQARLTTLAQAP